MTLVRTTLFEDSLPKHRKILVAVAIIAFASVLHLIALRLIQLDQPGLFFLPAVAAISARGGVRWGLPAAAIALGCAIVTDTAVGLGVRDRWTHIVGLGLFAAASPTLALVVGSLRDHSNSENAVRIEDQQLDIADREREMQIKAENQTTRDQLKRSNEELDQFAYVTSHDLKAPLRGIYNLATWIEEDLGDRCTRQTHEQIRRLHGRVERMESLINGLLEYSHVGKITGKLERVDVGLLLEQVIDWVGPPNGVEIEIGPGMPIFVADRLRLHQVFTNLIGNAVKHLGRPTGQVQIHVRDEGGFYRFSVTDNGQGIDARYHDRIFGIFQTLLPRDRLEGTGIGLSLVKKVVESKGGLVTVESQAGHGSTFSFTWPQDPSSSLTGIQSGGHHA